jgi:hypothetical protein
MVLVHQKLGTYSISLATPKYFYWPWQGSVKVPVRYSYRTDIGTLRGTCEQTFVRRGGVWKVVWNWHCVLPSYDGTSEIIKERRTATEGKVLDQNNRVLSEVSLRPFVYLVPGKITNQDKLIYDAAELLGIQRFTIDQKMHENSPADFYVPIGFARSGYDGVLLNRVAANPGVFITPLAQRTTYVDLEEKKRELFLQYLYSHHPEVFGQNGGKIAVRKTGGGEKDIYSGEARNGRDVIVSDQELHGLLTK